MIWLAVEADSPRVGGAVGKRAPFDTQEAAKHVAASAPIERCNCNIVLMGDGMTRSGLLDAKARRLCGKAAEGGREDGPQFPICSAKSGAICALIERGRSNLSPLVKSGLRRMLALSLATIHGAVSEALDTLEVQRTALVFGLAGDARLGKALPDGVLARRGDH